MVATRVLKLTFRHPKIDFYISPCALAGRRTPPPIEKAKRDEWHRANEFAYQRNAFLLALGVGRGADDSRRRRDTQVRGAPRLAEHRWQWRWRARFAALSGDKPTGRHADDDDDDDNDNGDDAADSEFALGAPASKRKRQVGPTYPEYLNCSICGVDSLTRSRASTSPRSSTASSCARRASSARCSVASRSPAPRVDDTGGRRRRARANGTTRHQSQGGVTCVAAAAACAR